MEKAYGPAFYLVIVTIAVFFLIIPMTCLGAWGTDLPNAPRILVPVLWVVGCLLSLALLVFWMVVAWRVMRAHERLARSGERVAGALEELARSRGAGSPVDPPSTPGV